MTQEATNSTNSVLDAFLKQRAKRQNNTALEARRLVNLYRHLPLFGEAFLETYNQMLLSSSPEVQMMLSDIIGGTVVRQYYDFLKARSKQNDTDNIIITDEEADNAYHYRHEESYLPSPDEVPPFALSSLSGGEMFSSDSAVLAAQVGAFERVLEKQNEFLARALEKIGQTTTGQTASIGTADLSALQQTQKEMLADLLERQNAQMNANIDTILKQTQQLSARQMEAVEKLTQRVPTRQDAYTVMIEEENMVPTSAQTQEQQIYTNRYRSPEQPVYHPAEVELEPIGDNSDIKKPEETPILDHYSALSATEMPEAPKTEELKETTQPDWKG